MVILQHLKDFYILKNVTHMLNFIYISLDPRTDGWFLVSSPGPTLTIVATYIYFCVSAGPKYMKNKKPYDLKNTMIIYNFIQILLSLYLVHEGLLAGWLYEYNYICQPVDYSYKPSSVRVSVDIKIIANKMNL